MDKIDLKARAKINLSLDVINKRSDNYHNVKMIMQTVDLHDKVLIKTQKEGIKIECNLPYVPTDERNIVYKIAKEIKQKFNIQKGVYIKLQKRIPVASGLGGGSADGAAVLLGMNRLFNLALSEQELMEIGKQFGADVAFCILGGTALAEGIGEKITTLPPLPSTPVLICKPKDHISTAYVYNNFDFNKVKNRPNTELLLQAIKNQDIKTLGKNMVNTLESVTLKEKPVINDIKNIMIQNGALGSIMTGSGTSVFGLFDNRYDACKVAERLTKISKEIFVTKTDNSKINY